MSHLDRFLNGSSDGALARRDAKDLALVASAARRQAAAARVREELAHIERLAQQAETAHRGAAAVQHITAIVEEARRLADGDAFTGELLFETLLLTKQRIEALI